MERLARNRAPFGSSTMNDMRAVIVPKSDQINADDLLAGPMTITVTKVDIRPGTEQPVSIHFDGDAGKPIKPIKTNAPVIVQLRGADANQYAGRSMTLYCDPKVKWGGLEVGGIRISHMSHIPAPQIMALTVTKGSKKPFTVQPLKAQAAPKRKVSEILDAIEAQFVGAATREAVDTVLASDDVQKALDVLTNGARDRLNAIIKTATDRTALPIANGPALAPADDDGWPGPA